MEDSKFGIRRHKWGTMLYGLNSMFITLNTFYDVDNPDMCYFKNNSKYFDMMILGRGETQVTKNYFRFSEKQYDELFENVDMRFINLYMFDIEGLIQTHNKLLGELFDILDKEEIMTLWREVYLPKCFEYKLNYEGHILKS